MCSDVTVYTHLVQYSHHLLDRLIARPQLDEIRALAA